MKHFLPINRPQRNAATGKPGGLPVAAQQNRLNVAPRWLLAGLLLLLPRLMQAQTPSFSEVTTPNLPGVAFSSSTWGDYDNDGDLDILLTGYTGSTAITKVYQNNGGSFAEVTTANLPGVYYSSAAWGDYDNDGDLDILLAGVTGTTAGVTKVFQNNGGSFAEVTTANLPGVYYGSAAWGDYDNDGDLDILLTGVTGGTGVTKVYQNNGGSFAEVTTANLPGVSSSSAAWGDYDNDGDLDILLTGVTGGTGVTKVYQNNGGSFAEVTTANLPGVSSSSAAWGDYDNDGDLDILLTGVTGGTGVTKVYQNNGGSFAEVTTANLPGVYAGSAAWGDYDNDGDLDILLTGDNGGTRVTKVYQNNGGSFAEVTTANLPGVSSSSAAWGDYDNDGDLDILLTGYTSSTAITKVYQNNTATANTAPAAPANLKSAVTGQQVILSWDAATDAQTPAAGLSYNLYVGTSPGQLQLVSPQASLQNGYRQLPALGNGQTGTSFLLKDLPYGTYYWSVQAVDAAFAGSNFATEGSFTVAPPSFSEVTTPNLPGVAFSSSTWGDYDNDGDLDILLTGYTGSTAITKVYQNNGGSFAEVTTANLPGVYYSSAAWGDYDNDGDLDILLAGVTGTTAGVTKVFQNNGGSFAEVTTANLPGVYYGSAAWGDYDNDGDLDILLTGVTGGTGVTKVYQNNGGSFAEVTTANLPGVSSSSAAWGDYDNDGDLDILLTGVTGGTGVTKVYQNNGGSFAEVTTANLPGVSSSSAAWGDYDNDGDLDILLTGVTGGTGVTKVYQNNGGSFAEVTTANLPGVYAGSAAWGDYDNDGDLDILLTGDNGGTRVTKVYQNNGGSFAEVTTANLPGVSSSSAAWGDYDNDGDLDILLTGYTSSTAITKVYQNNTATANTAPAAPANLKSAVTGQQVILSWDAATDAQTPAAGLSYNLYVGTSPGQLQLVSPQASLQNGYRQLPALGNGQTGTSFLLKDLPYGTYYWSVQAVDAAFAGSNFATEGSFIIGNTNPIATNDAYQVNEDQTLTVAAAIGVLHNDTDADGNTLTAAVVPEGNVTHGNLVLDPNGSFTYAPTANYNGPDAFTYLVSDGQGGTARATVSINVIAVNQAPIAIAQAVSTDEDIAKAITLTASDVDGDALTYAIVTEPAHGALSGTGTSRTYTPNANYYGTDSFTFTANDGSLTSEPVTVTINVMPVNDAPVAVNDAFSTAEDTQLAGTTVLVNDTDADGNALTAVLGSGPAHGTLILNSNGTYTYNPAANYSGTDAFTYRAHDGTASSNLATVTITVIAVNQAPVANNQSVSTKEDIAKAITLTASDVDGDALTYAIVAQPAHGTLSGTGASRTYTPNANYNGPDSFTFKVNDGTTDGNIATVTITVTALNYAPVLGTLAVKLAGATSTVVDPILINSTIEASVLLTDADFPNDIVTVQWSWDDGSAEPPYSVTTGRNITKSHTYTSPGVYTVRVEVTDQAAATTSVSFQYVVVYDPNGGFVTGAGWITSPAGAYVTNPDATGRAHFGFVSKYQKGATVPTGKTDFEFKTADISFTSTFYDWLVIAGAKAQYKGEGTINGSGNYGFLVTALDGQLNSGGGEDKFRIKIWDKATGATVYDNNIESADDALPSTALGGGAIVIHGPKKAVRVSAQLAMAEEPTQLIAYPNPFRGKMTAEFSVTQDEAYTLDVYDVKGSLVKRLQSGNAKAGKVITAIWEPERPVKGVYIIRLVTPSKVQHLRVVQE